MSSLAYYPHCLQFLATPHVCFFNDVSHDLQYSMQAYMAGGDGFPCFVGPQSADPMFQFSTASVYEILSQCSEYNVCKDFTAGEVILSFRRGKKLAFREAMSGSVHPTFVLDQSALLAWESLSASEEEDVQISGRLMTARYDSTTDPFDAKGNQAVPTPYCDGKYSLGPIVYNGRVITSIHRIDWQNNLQYNTRKTAVSSKDPDWQSIDSMSPVVRATTNDLDEAMYTTVVNDAYGGQAMSELRIFLRKRTAPGFFVPDSTAQHIELKILGGWKGAASGSGSGGSPYDQVIEFHPAQIVDAQGRVAQDGLIYKNLASKIPNTGVVLPTLAAYSPETIPQNTPIFVPPDIQDGGIPTSYSISAGALPAGATLNAVNGVVTGVVTDTPGPYSATIRATNAAGDDDEALSITVT